MDQPVGEIILNRFKWSLKTSKIELFNLLG